MADYISSYTGEEIDSAIETVTDISSLQAGEILQYIGGGDISGLSLNGDIFPRYDDTGDTYEGKVLTIDEYGNLNWSTPSGGGSVDGLPSLENADPGSVLSIVVDGTGEQQGEARLDWVTVIPDYSEASNGDVLTYIDGNLEWSSSDSSSNSLPDTTGVSDGNVLTCYSHLGMSTIEWSTPSYVPDYSGASAGQVLTYDGSDIAWSSLPISSIDDVLPSYDNAYANIKYLTPDGSGGLDWTSPYPSYSTSASNNVDEGKVLTVQPNGTLNWTSPFPSNTSADEGKVLKIQSNGALDWSSPFPVCDCAGERCVLVAGACGMGTWVPISELLSQQ